MTPVPFPWETVKELIGYLLTACGVATTFYLGMRNFKLQREKDLAEQAKINVERTRERDAENLGSILRERQQIADDNAALRKELREVNERLRAENERLYGVNDELRKANEGLVKQVEKTSLQYTEMEGKYNKLQALYDQLQKTVEALDYKSAILIPPAVLQKLDA